MSSRSVPVPADRISELAACVAAFDAIETDHHRELAAIGNAEIRRSARALIASVQSVPADPETPRPSRPLNVGLWPHHEGCLCVFCERERNADRI